MRDRLLGFALGVLLITGMSANGPDCPPGFRCSGGPAAGAPCVIEDGPYRGQPGTLVNGACLLSVEGGAAAAHQHVIEGGLCPLCGAPGESWLSFNVQAPARGAAPSGSARAPAYETRQILRCPRCRNVFTP